MSLGSQDSYPLTGEDGIEVVGIQAGVSSTVRCQLKYFMRGESYLEVSLEKAMNLPKMDAGTPPPGMTPVDGGDAVTRK
jgi:hypothetical protein